MEENKLYVKLNPNQELPFKRTYKINPDETIIIEGGNIYEFVKKLQQENAELREEINPQTNYTTKVFYTAEEYKRLEQENAELKTVHKQLKQMIKSKESLLEKAIKENAELKQAFQKYKDMEAKGLEEFKDVGGCWGCGIQSASDQYFNDAKNYRHTLEEIREDLETQVYCECSECGNDDYGTCIECMTKRYIDKINEVLND